LRGPNNEDTALSRMLDSLHANNCRYRKNGNRLGFVHHPTLLQWALGRLARDGQSRWEAWRQVIVGLPSAKYLQELSAYFPASTGYDSSVLKAWDRKATLLKHKRFSWTRTGMLCSDAMMVREGIVMDAHSGKTVGLTMESADSVEERLKQLNDERFGEEAEPRVPVLAKYWQEFFFVGFGRQPMQFSVAKIACATVNAAIVYENEMKCMEKLAQYGFAVVLLNRDGAQENRSATARQATIPASEFGVLPDRGSFKDSEDDVKVAMRHPSLPGYYVFLTLDNVHILKSLGNALESSGKPLKSGARWLTKTCKALDGPGDKAYMFAKSIIRADWERERDAAQADRSYVPVQSDFVRKLKEACFKMTPWSRMNVSLQMKILSATVKRYYADKNPALAWYTGACNDIMDQFNGQVGRTRQARLGAISAKNMAPLNRLEEIFAEFLDWKAGTWDVGFPMKYLAATTHSNLRQSILGFTAMCRFYIGKFPNEAIPQWRVNDDAIEHHFRNVRGAAGDNTNPTVQQCCTATRHATIIRLFRDTAGNSGGSPDNADDNDDEYRSFSPPEQVPAGMSKKESLFAFNFQK